jgi:hypothetical protein
VPLDVVQGLVEVLLVVTDPALLGVVSASVRWLSASIQRPSACSASAIWAKARGTLGQFIGAAELLQRLLVLTLLAQVEPFPDRRVFAAGIARLGVLAARGGVAAPGEQDDGKE